MLLELEAQGQVTHRYLWGPAVDQVLLEQQVISPEEGGMWHCAYIWEPQRFRNGALRGLELSPLGGGFLRVRLDRGLVFALIKINGRKVDIRKGSWPALPADFLDAKGGYPCDFTARRC